MESSPINYLELLDWRRQVAELFVDLRCRPPGAVTLSWFRASKDTLYRDHPQSPLPAEQRRSFVGLPYWPFDAAARVAARLEPAAHPGPELRTPEGTGLVRIGRLTFTYHGEPCQLGAYWMQGYGGGLFVPFRDGTNGVETYGGGRYVLDTVKSADLGTDAAAGLVTLDFNYAYHPSCVFDPRWVCPLAPPDNRLTVPVLAGERLRNE